MQNYNGNAENGSDAQTIVATQDGDEMLFFAEEGDGRQWVSSQQTVDLEAMR